jgi:hypothetical protein
VVEPRGQPQAARGAAWRCGAQALTSCEQAGRREGGQRHSLYGLVAESILPKTEAGPWATSGSCRRRCIRISAAGSCRRRCIRISAAGRRGNDRKWREATDGEEGEAITGTFTLTAYEPRKFISCDFEESDCANDGSLSNKVANSDCHLKQHLVKWYLRRSLRVQTKLQSFSIAISDGIDYLRGLEGRVKFKFNGVLNVINRNRENQFLTLCRFF